uniref:Transmembrane protein n=1 Tax=Panagrellus redivivus TaxID=6233 RepID=A0A7E4WDK9_PANRE
MASKMAGEVLALCNVTIGGSTAAFDPIVVNSAYKTDKVDTSKWSLAYYDFDASRIGYVAVGSIAAISISSGIACFDYLSNGKFTLSPILRLMDDATELGPLTVVPITLMFIVSGVLLRLHSMRIFRIYQSLEDPDKFFAIFPGFFRMYRRLDLTRSEILVLDELYESDSFHNLLFSGNTKLGSSPVLLNIDAFKTPLHKSYFLNESDTLPHEFHKAESPSRSSRASKRPPSRSGSDVPPAPPPF